LTVIVPHHKTRAEVIARIDKAVDDIVANGIGGSVQIVDPKKSWNESTMTFSLTGRMGFIKVPLSGTVTVDDVNVTVICDLPPLLKSFLGEAKAQAGIQKEITKLIA
jgi:hypothetical protein